MRKPLALALATLTAASVAALVPTAANAADTNVTFTLTGGSLTLSAPGSASLSAAGNLGVTGTSVSGQLGNSTVDDARGSLAHTVTVNMSTTNFTDGSGDTIAKSNATGSSGATTPTGVAVAVPTLTGQTIGAAGGATILTLTGVIGSASTTYNPTVSVTIPANSIAGSYSGTVTQTAS
ncbi:MAG: hypothetical protein QOJ03_1023 [Frankiaceae bacterium]|nr:hypothetical protein [Frankiaceae bacterium]